MSDKYQDTFKFIKKTIDTNQDYNHHIHFVPDPQAVANFSNSDANNSIVDSYLSESGSYAFSLDQDVPDEDIEELLNSITKQFDKTRLTLLVDSCKVSTMDAIIKPFGLAGVIFKDKVGGNVDTIHNVREGVYATDENRRRYEERPEYVYDDYHDKNDNYSKHKDILRDMKDSGELVTDAYTKMQTNDPSVEHIIPASKISNDPAVSLARINGPEVANDDKNLAYISRQLNSSKKDKTPSEYVDDTKALSAEKRQQMLDSLNNREEPLSPLAEKRKALIEQKNAVVENETEIKQMERNAQQKIDRNLSGRYYKGKEFMQNVGKTGAVEGLKMGTQQAVGLLLREFSLAVFDEIGDLFSKRQDIKINAIFMHDLKERLSRIANRILSKWKDVVKAFRDGSISGFFSNIITVIINAFITTSKRAVKMIREGFYSLFKALKLLMFPPENMTTLESAHESTKLIASGLIISGGIFIEESLQKALVTVPVIGIFSDLISSVIIGIVTGLSMALVTYLIDKIDIFKVNVQKRQEYISSKLDSLIEEGQNEYKEMYDYATEILGLTQSIVT
ncbi:MAG: hypothetical protein ACYCWE_02935 [Eubacteriales bacterium]